jgi:hypothetical protein
MTIPFKSVDEKGIWEKFEWKNINYGKWVRELGFNFRNLFLDLFVLIQNVHQNLVQNTWSTTTPNNHFNTEWEAILSQ